MTNEKDNANVKTDDNANADEQNDANQDGGESGGEDGGELELLKKELDELKAASKGKDSKISEYQKQLSAYKAKEFQSKNETEQLTEYKKLVERFEKREKYRTMFKDAGVDPEEFANILQESDDDKQAELFKEILERERKKSAENALIEFKKKELDKKPTPPKNTNGGTKTNKNADVNNAIRAAAGKK